MIIDITRPIHPKMAIYPNNPQVAFQQVSEVGEGRNALSLVSLGTHTGTHIDSPRHIHPDGTGTLVYSLDQMCGPCEVVDLAHISSVITAADVPAEALAKAGRILFKTRNSSGDPDVFDANFVALDDSAAEELVRRGIKLVGLDALSIRKRGVKNHVHETLIDAGMCVLEGLWLADVPAGKYELLCLPIKWDLDGAPARAVLHRG